MKFELDEYSQFCERIRCTVKTEDGEYVFWWDPSAGVTPEASMSSQWTSLSYQERMEAAARARTAHHLIYDLDQNL